MIAVGKSAILVSIFTYSYTRDRRSQTDSISLAWATRQVGCLDSQTAETCGTNDIAQVLLRV